MNSLANIGLPDVILPIIKSYLFGDYIELRLTKKMQKKSKKYTREEYLRRKGYRIPTPKYIRYRKRCRCKSGTIAKYPCGNCNRKYTCYICRINCSKCTKIICPPCVKHFGRDRYGLRYNDDEPPICNECYRA